LSPKIKIMGEDFDWKVGQVVEEIRRMKPDIEAEVNAKFGKQIEKLGLREQGVWGNVQASEVDKQAPEISEESTEGIKISLQTERSDLETQIAGYRQERTEFRTRFVINQYFDESTEEEKTAAFDAVNVTLNPPAAQNEADDMQQEGDYFNPEDFETANSNDAEGEETLSDRFNDAAVQGYVPPAGGIEP
jgi:hypothetical protein